MFSLQKDKEKYDIIPISLHLTCSKPFFFFQRPRTFLMLQAHINFYDWLSFQSPAYLCTTISLLIFMAKGRNVLQLCLELDDTSRCHSGQQDKVYLFLALVQNGLWYSCSQPLWNISALTHLNYDILCIASFTSMLWNKRPGRTAISSRSHSAGMPNAYTVKPIK